ncbi:hypothetical protein [Streptacidiphilus rugosus]|uniref:hypothetical protein n=1 Tax=Streptacidiphilus rugosus TaxID=405783 RepID=UPI00055BAA31|nr:hypothetical protein [Streptacidiphilus rugosus]
MAGNFAHRVRTTALLAVGAAALSGVLVPGTAYAKSGVHVQVNTQVLRIGQNVQVTAAGGDDSVRYTYLCLDQRVGGGNWQSLGCSSAPWRSYSRTVRATTRGTEQFRARLLGRRAPSGPLWLDRVSGAVTVLVR